MRSELFPKVRTAPSFLSLLCAAATLLFSVLSIKLALARHLDTTDGYTFIQQSRRLLDPLYAWIWPMLIRPRALVALFSLVEGGYTVFLARFPTLVEYHLLMVVVALAFIGTWIRFISRIWGKEVGYATGCLLALCATLFENASLCMSDILAGLLYGCLLNLLFTHIQKGDNHPLYLRRLGRPVMIGLCGALLSTAKHQVFLLFPFTLFLMGLLLVLPFSPFRKSFCVLKLHALWTGTSFLIFLLSLDGINRILTEPGQGVGSHIHYFWQIVHYAKEVVPFYTIGSDKFTYLKDLKNNYGYLLWALTLGSLPFTIWKLRTLRIKASEIGYKSDFAKSLLNTLFVIGATLFLIQTQLFANKETRYLLPFLPLILGVVGVIVVTAKALLGPERQMVWVILVVIGLVHPVLETLNREKSLVAENDHWSESGTGYDRMWLYFMTPTPNARTCASIHACNSNHSGLNFMWAHIFYHMELKPNVHECETKADFRLARNAISPRTQLGACYLLTESDPLSKTGIDFVAQKYVGSHLTTKEKGDLASKLDPREFLDCGPAEGMKSLCFVSRRFRDL
jgi:hypothetical protein